MKKHGNGYCKSGYYAGHDGKGIESQEDCNNVCLQEPECLYAALHKGKTCSRYNEKICELNSDRNHITYKKDLDSGSFLD